jgi:hypothetical protein
MIQPQQHFVIAQYPQQQVLLNQQAFNVQPQQHMQQHVQQTVQQRNCTLPRVRRMHACVLQITLSHQSVCRHRRAHHNGRHTCMLEWICTHYFL